MKISHSLLKTICFFTFLIAILVWFCWYKCLTKETSYITNIRPSVVDTYPTTTWWEVWANPESTRYTREMIKKDPYWIFSSPSENEIRINIPRFLEQTTTERREFIEKIAHMDRYDLTLHISWSEPIDIAKFIHFMEDIDRYKSITFIFYDIPENYYDIFDRFHSNFDMKNISFIFYGQMFPDGFHLNAFIKHLSEMVMRSLLENQKLDTLSLSFEETADFAFILDEEAENALKKILIKNLILERITINASPMWLWDDSKWKARVEKFFREARAETIEIDRVGQKKDGSIILYGF